MPTKQTIQTAPPTRAVRITLAFMALGLSIVFGVAIKLKPDSRGFGTHQQLGLPPCQFRQYIGVSCPHCGMTTSFSNFVRGRFSDAWKANPAGIPLAAICLCCIPFFACVSVMGRWIFTDRPFWWFLLISISYLSLAFVVWILRLMF